jgi:hypothetical protein
MNYPVYSNNAVTHLQEATDDSKHYLLVADPSMFPHTMMQGEYFFVSVETEVYKIIRVEGDKFFVDSTYQMITPHAAKQNVELRMCSQLLDAMGDMGEY